MATINLGNPSPIEGEVSHVDLKQPTVQVHPVTLDTPSASPATTPEQNSPSEEHNMAGNKVFSTQRADDKARKLAATLTLEEQVRTLHIIEVLGPTGVKDAVESCTRRIITFEESAGTGSESSYRSQKEHEIEGVHARD